MDVRAIRLQAPGSMTQKAFANALGVSPATIRNWEQNRRSPTGSARVLLSVMQRNPRAVFDAIAMQQSQSAPMA
jgi:putative transcriptional regulator